MIRSPPRSHAPTRASTERVAASPFSRPPGLAHPRLRRAQPFDLVLANILPRPLVRLATPMRRAIAAGGFAVLSGLLNHQAREVAMAYRAAGFRLAGWERRAGWSILTLQRA